MSSSSSSSSGTGGTIAGNGSSSSSSGYPRPEIQSAPFPPDAGVDGGGTCPAGWFLWEDQAWVNPDRLCHKQCENDVECGGAYAHCRTLGLTLGGDYSCNGKIGICDSRAENDCP